MDAKWTDLAIAGGMENMSQAPHVIRGAREGFSLGQGKLEDLLMASLMDPFCGLFMAQTAEKLGTQYEISREEQDEYALRSTACAKAPDADQTKTVMHANCTPLRISPSPHGLPIWTIAGVGEEIAGPCSAARFRTLRVVDCGRRHRHTIGNLHRPYIQRTFSSRDPKCAIVRANAAMLARASKLWSDDT